MKDRELDQEREIMRNRGTESERECNRTEVGIRSFILMLSGGYHECKGERQCHEIVTHTHTLIRKIICPKKREVQGGLLMFHCIKKRGCIYIILSNIRTQVFQEYSSQKY